MRLRCRFPILIMLPALLTATGCFGPSGYRYNGRDSLWRVWCDCNTLGQPAAFYEVIERRPYDSAWIQYFRWLHGQGPGNATWIVPAAPPDEIPAS